MFGFPVEGASDIFCNNGSVFKNVLIPESVLSKKQHSISYHSCREAIAAGIARVAKVGTLSNLADMFTKCCLERSVKNCLINFILIGNSQMDDMLT